ncbi:MAG: DUF2812 domain-containing protein [Ruminococcaceae bacterium]|nr:DUF2812 domain-containing protein [Oscillospiraceae bacterium]
MKTKILFKNILYQNPINEERVLNEYAKKGWVLKKSNSFYSKLEKTDGENKKYSVQYISNLKRIGNKLSDQDELFIELCEADNWKFISKASNFLYFETDISNEKKIRTDDEAYKKSIFKMLLFQEVLVFSIFLFAGLFAFFVSYKTGVLFVNRFHLPLVVLGIVSLLFSLPTLILTLVEKTFLDFPNEKMERIKAVLKKAEGFSVIFSIFISLFSLRPISSIYDVLFLCILLILTTTFWISFQKGLKFKNYRSAMASVGFIGVLAFLLILFNHNNREKLVSTSFDELNCKTEKECFEIANNVYKNYSGSDEGLEIPAFVDDKVHNYEGTYDENLTIISTMQRYYFEDKTTKEVFGIIVQSTCSDLLRDYYLKYCWCDSFDKSFDYLKEVLEKNDYILERKNMLFIAKDGVIIVVINSTPEADKETTE